MLKQYLQTSHLLFAVLDSYKLNLCNINVEYNK